jgi:hypothetical protein
MIETMNHVRLLRRADQVFASFEDSSEETEVKPVWARPLSGRGGEVCFLDREKKREVFMLKSLEALDPESRRVAEAELGMRYLVPRVIRVLRTEASCGVRYWHVRTDLGERRFALKHASRNAVWVTPDHLILRDTLGCRYEIKPYSALDAKSKTQVDKVI